MAFVDHNDRNSISGLHLGTSQQMRDASASSWKKPPTKISPPTNASRTPSGNPLNGRLSNNLHNTRGGNPAAQRTVTSFVNNARGGPPPAKKQKVDTSIPRSRKKVSQSSNSASRPKLGDSDDTGVIFVDDEYDDVGEPIESDDLNLQGPSRSRNSRAILEGPSTALLRQETRHQERLLLAPEDLGQAHEDQGQDPDDPIECYSPQSSEPSVNQKPGNVKSKIDVFEKRIATTQPPFIDLRNPPKSNLKKNMKPKNPSAAPSNGSKPDPKPEPIPPAKPDKRQFLPIKAWYLGRKLFDEPYSLVWNPAGKMTLRSGKDPSVKAKHSEEIDINWVAQSISFVGPEESYPDKVFVLETFEKFPDKKTGHQKPFGANYSAYFKQGGKHAEGQIMIKFDSGSPTWSDATYWHFVDWLKTRVDKRESLRGKGGDARWETMKRVNLLAEAAEARIKREIADAANGNARAKNPAVPGLPALDPWSPPATIAIANTAKVTTRSQRLGSPTTPIEIESPTRPRPRPRPINSRPESDTAGGGHEPVRRSARQSVAPQRPHVDPDEVILVYPPGQTGAVNITNGDVSRLTPGEFLNDTLIEFGLKLWLQDLEKENPELVKQIHVFSSFFYKKLNKKNPQEGYESVRKWTAKFDLFDKKYIIVPINENLHWYLAIIYQPEHTLKPPPPTKSPTTRRKTRQGVEQSPEVDQVPVSRTETSSRPPDSKASSVTRRTPTPIDTAASGSGSRSPSGTLSPSSNMQAEAEVVNELTACSITEDDTDVAAPEASDKSEAHDTDEHDSLFDDPMDVDVDTETPLGAIGEQSSLPPDSGDLLNDGGSHTASEGPAEPEVMDVDDPDQSMDPLDLFADDPSPPTVSEPVKTANFYSAKSRGKRKATSPPLEALPAELYEEEVEDDQPWTYVFTLDSLGSRHPKVTNVLAQYLKFEAQERKGIPLEMSRKAIGKIALVPHQPNFCDCGIYLLHLAETFISNPVFYHDLIIKQKGPTNSLDRQLQWNDDRTKTLRQKLTERIGELSKEWKKNRAAQKELEKTQEEVVAESSDDDVDIVDTTPAAPPRPEKTPKTGKAMRMRG
ncbi:hypothetical protein B0H19DRAFT_1368602 [Mycena capillaripes]|nr:hypothetical protein B0H19DRAFT_1368602 [Mycena capillaripes]